MVSVRLCICLSAFRIKVKVKVALTLTLKVHYKTVIGNRMLEVEPDPQRGHFGHQTWPNVLEDEHLTLLVSRKPATIKHEQEVCLLFAAVVRTA